MDCSGSNHQNEPFLIDFNYATYTGDVHVPTFISPYSSPEIVMDYEYKNDHTFTTDDDVYALGVLLYYFVEYKYPIPTRKMNYRKMMDYEIVLFKKNKKDFGDLITKSLIGIAFRNNITSFLNTLFIVSENPNLQILTSDYYYALKDPTLKKFVDRENYYVYILISLICFVIFGGVLLSLCLFCRLCCKCIKNPFKKKKKGRQDYYENFDDISFD